MKQRIFSLISIFLGIVFALALIEVSAIAWLYVEDGRYTGEMELYAYGPHKAVAMRRVAAEENIDLLRSWAYSDSATDIPMLETVGNPVAVNPDRELLKVARERSWEIRRFVHPVRLRDRVPVPPAGPTAAVAVTALAGAGALFVWWKRHRPTEPLGRSTPWGRFAGVARRRAPSLPPWLPGR